MTRLQVNELAEKLESDRITAVPPQNWEVQEYDDTDAARLNNDDLRARRCRMHVLWAPCTRVNIAH